MEFSRQEYWSGLPFPFPGDLPYVGIKPGTPALRAYSLPSESPGSPGKGLSPKLNLAGTLMLGFEAPEQWKIHFLSHPVYNICYSSPS